MPFAKEIHRGEMWKSGGAGFAAVGFIGAVRHQIDAKLALRRLDGGVSLALGNTEALGIELEMMDYSFHRALHLAAARRRVFVVWCEHRPLSSRRVQPLDALFHDAHGLAHLLHAD